MKRFTIKPIRLFVTLSAIFCALLLCMFFFSDGWLIKHYFWWDYLDTGMDYFYSIACTRGGTPYSGYQTLYPPLANLFFYSIIQFVPYEIANSWGSSFGALGVMRLTNRDIRLQQSTLLPFLLLLVVASALLIFLVEYILSDKQQGTSRSAALAIILSFGFTWAIERGNIIVLALILSLFFLAFYHHPNRVYRELAYIALASAAGLKLYPAFLGILLLGEKQWKPALHTLAYGLAAFILPCFLLRDGLSSISMFLSILFARGNQNSLTLRHTGVGIKDTAANVIAVYARLTGTEEIIYSPWLNVAQIIAYALCALLLLITLMPGWKNWMRLTLICLAMTSFQSGAYYTLVYMIIPLIYFFKEENELNQGNLVHYILLVGLALQVPLFDLDSLKCKALFIQLSLVGLWLTVAIDSIRILSSSRTAMSTEN